MKRYLFSNCLAFALAVCAVSAQAQTNILSVKLDDETRRLLREAAKDKWPENFAFTILGGGLAVAAGILQSWYSHRKQTHQKKQEDAEFAANVLRAIRPELEALSEIYDKGIGGQLKLLVPGQIFEVRLGLTQDWFTVFNTNAVHIGKIEGEVSRRIVAIYAMLKGLIEEFRINNDYLAHRAQIGFEILRSGNELHLKEKRQIVEKWMVDQAIKLREVDQSLGVAVNELFALLDQRGIK